MRREKLSERVGGLPQTSVVTVCVSELVLSRCRSGGVGGEHRRVCGALTSKELLDGAVIEGANVNILVAV